MLPWAGSLEGEVYERPSLIEDYGLVGNTRTAALVGKDGSIDWMCVPRFDSGACFAALLGEPEHGRWRLAPAGEFSAVRRAYRRETLVLETEFETSEGAVSIIECMPVWHDRTDVVRVVEGLHGRVVMRMELIIRPGYGAITPWVRRVHDALLATAAPDSLQFRTPVETEGREFTTVAGFTVTPGQRGPSVRSWFPSPASRPLPRDAGARPNMVGGHLPESRRAEILAAAGFSAVEQHLCEDSIVGDGRDQPAPAGFPFRIRQPLVFGQQEDGI